MVMVKAVRPEYFKEMDYWDDKYLEKFGKHSLDRVIMPIYNPFLSPSEEAHQKKMFEKAIAELKEAIENNEPIEQIDPEAWDSLVF